VAAGTTPDGATSSAAIVASHAGSAIVSGAIGSASASEVGVSNVFTRAANLVELWRDAPRAIACRFPGLPLVGYESGTNLEAALRNGFAAVGRLRVWVK
jgi:N-acetylglucosamine kinase-like BadF-type ATPase